MRFLYIILVLTFIFLSFCIISSQGAKDDITAWKTVSRLNYCDSNLKITFPILQSIVNKPRGFENLLISESFSKKDRELLLDFKISEQLILGRNGIFYIWEGNSPPHLSSNKYILVPTFSSNKNILVLYELLILLGPATVLLLLIQPLQLDTLE